RLNVQHVSAAADRADQGVVLAVDFGAQIHDVDFYDVGPPAEIGVGQMLVEHGLGKHLARAAHEALEQLIFFFGEVHHFAALFNFVLEKIHLDVAGFKHGAFGGVFGGDGGPAQDGADAG